jgi:hypothetical protein
MKRVRFDVVKDVFDGVVNAASSAQDRQFFNNTKVRDTRLFRQGRGIAKDHFKQSRRVEQQTHLLEVSKDLKEELVQLNADLLSSWKENGALLLCAHIAIPHFAPPPPPFRPRHVRPTAAAILYHPPLGDDHAGQLGVRLGAG